MLHFRFLKISVSIDLSYWVFLLLVIATIGGLYIENFIWATVFTSSILIHEYGHALTAYFFGAKPIVVLQAFGGKTIFNPSGITDRQNFLIILGGPLFQALWTLIPYLLLKFNLFNNCSINYILLLIMYINSKWLLLNLIPIAPLDCGSLLRYVLETKFGRKGYLASLIIGLVAAAIAIPFFYLQGYHWIFIIQLFICGWHYCKLWQNEQK